MVQAIVPPSRRRQGIRGPMTEIKLKNTSDITIAETSALAIFAIPGSRRGPLVYRGNIKEIDGRRWLVLDHQDTANRSRAARIDLTHACFVAEDITESFMKGLIPSLEAEDEEPVESSAEPT